MNICLFGPIVSKAGTRIGHKSSTDDITGTIKRDSYDNLLTEVNHLMDPKRTFSCFVVDMKKHCGIDLP